MKNEKKITVKQFPEVTLDTLQSFTTKNAALTDLYKKKLIFAYALLNDPKHKLIGLTKSQTKDTIELSKRVRDEKYKHLTSSVIREKRMLFHSLDWRPVTKNGSISKRIKKFMHKELQIKLNNEVLGKIGTFISEETDKPRIYYYDFTKSLTWEAGNFGDHHSCFWQGRKSIRQDMMHSGTFSAFRLYNSDKENSGIGRSWIKEIVVSSATPTIETTGTVYLVFNAYGPDLEKQVSYLTNILDLPAKKVLVSNNKDTCGGLYINNGEGYLIGDISLIGDKTTIDIQMEEKIFNERHSFRGFGNREANLELALDGIELIPPYLAHFITTPATN